MASTAAMLERSRSFHALNEFRSILSPKMERAECSCEDECKLVSFDSLPDFMKDNEFILGNYRCQWPLKQTLLSVFSIHNETLNIWTHLFGFFIFLLLTIATLNMVYTPARTADNHLMQVQGNSIFYSLYSNYSIVSRLGYTISSPSPHPLARWPFFAYLFGAMFCLLTSSACHLLSCHSEHYTYTMLRLDYAGISTLIVTSFYPLVYYTFVCEPVIRNLYICFITVFGAATVLVSLVPAFQTPEFRIVRALLFCCMAVSGLVPIIHKMVVFGDRPEAVATVEYEMLMGVFYGLGVLVYATRVPERWMPGKFDLVGHSHQLFHLLVIAGAYTQYLAGLVYLQWRDIDGCCGIEFVSS